MAFSGKDSILDQIYEKQTCSDSHYEDLILYDNLGKCIEHKSNYTNLYEFLVVDVLLYNIHTL